MISVRCAMTLSVIDDTAQQQFAVSMGGATAKLEYERDFDRLLLLHTEVPEAFRGMVWAADWSRRP